MLPPALRRDFQDLPAGRQGVYEVLDRLLAEHHGAVIVPMTVVEPAHLAETVGRLRERGHEVHHIAPLRESFAVSRLDHCLERLRGTELAAHLRTDHLTVPQVADHVTGHAGLRPAPGTHGRLRGRLRRLHTGLRHIRFD